jgi:hypothetical protein
MLHRRAATTNQLKPYAKTKQKRLLLIFLPWTGCIPLTRAWQWARPGQGAVPKALSQLPTVYTTLLHPLNLALFYWTARNSRLSHRSLGLDYVMNRALLPGEGDPGSARSLANATYRIISVLSGLTWAYRVVEWVRSLRRVTLPGIGESLEDSSEPATSAP